MPSLYPREILEYVALSGIPRGPQSKFYVVDPVHGSDTNSGDRWTKPLATIGAAEALCVTGHHDTVIVVASGTAITETGQCVWDKNLTHIIGLGADTRYGKRTRVISGADDLSPFIIVSGYGCVWKNLRIVHEQAADTGSLVCVRVSGERNVFENVEFAGPATTSSAIDGACALQISGGSENLFKGCAIGLDTVLSATGVMALVFAATGGAARNRFEDCSIIGYAGSTSAGLVELLGNSGIDRTTLFDRCEFVNLGTSTMASAFVIAAGFDPSSKRFLLKDCVGIGFADWEAAAQGAVYLSGGTQTAGGYTGLMQIATVA